MILILDVLIFYAALILTLRVRYLPYQVFLESFNNHISAFSLLLVVWIIIFYLADLYHPKTLRSNWTQFGTLVEGVLISTLISIIIFYLFGDVFRLTPKTNLLMFALVYLLLDFLTRIALKKTFIKKDWQSRVFFVGSSKTIMETCAYVESNPQLGFFVAAKNNTENKLSNVRDFTEILKHERIDVVVIDRTMLDAERDFLLNLIYTPSLNAITVLSATDFFEMVFQKISLNEISDEWFIEHFAKNRTAYEVAKKVLSFVLAVIAFIVLLPLSIIIALAIKLTSKGPFIYKQSRIGHYNKHFVVYKFRTMIQNAEGPLFTKEKDARLTTLGVFLRFTHLYEIPQLWNIIKGDISFIGPRPERVELARHYESLPYYHMRHVVRPGLTGWAQINSKASTSLEEAYEKLCYDIYYIKHRNIFLDFLIILKTIRYIVAPIAPEKQ